ncbi:MAG: hypothetical protein CO135_01210 [Candidatus Levybacteria bacterium CG_4_9_14_3_um_filter_35_16]|nr:MAG: hypothetical protein COW87_03280 [Candidatus Levybacteria bacterium CG22_combo_CG10-13_8_21_14_all_35_11]PIY94152.1 MAG: hypothetical protein COY68_03985 [Candidatus Levybacteria bacterium CG_4_10_14_0_8_um_filter_35_23]PIZ98292.1 MAG: hypothetical protein COX78_03325 [Candidatus Levybacteria bacterium CG_4_10_14_0_2_um_filter_35_8]PJA91399.1 MAG: hypothetical protein CO135_01210 [Candidatus Levybacteria bacterium CG_4_9_14_3_um_filter_35_16]PJC54190.1 MAG: hypothetical protein CO028_03
MLLNFAYLGFGILFLWLIILTVYFWKLSSHYNKLTKGANGKSLNIILENLLKDMDLSKKDIEKLKRYSEKLYKDSLLHIQRVGLVRYNPFKDTGGDQSFVLSLTDGHNTGVVISALYSRSGTRWYAKRVNGGKGVDNELSEEEKRSIKEARGINK